MNTKTYSFEENTVGDLYKDAYGMRPTGFFWEKWDNSTDDQKQEIWDSLLKELDAEEERINRLQMQAIAKFEAKLQELQQSGAPDRQTAARWYLESLEADCDAQYADWMVGLPSGTIAKAME